MAQKRYDQLLDLVLEVKPKTILEIGVWNGHRACKMAEVALGYNEAVHYLGFDLFENATEQTDEEEFNKKSHNSVHRVRNLLQRLQDENPGFTFELHRGNTRKTLKENQYSVDFAYVDGGHSVETIRHDFSAVKNSRFIVFDDYYICDELGCCPDITKFGANAVLDGVSGVKILPSQDRVSGGGIVCLAVIDQRKET